MKSASIRTVQHRLAALIAEVEQGAEIIITRRSLPVARLSPISPPTASSAGTRAALRAYWKHRPLPPAVRSSVATAALVATGRGDV
jgi:prevent-host-death family protein